MDRLTAPHAAGCVIFRLIDNQPHVLLILDQYGKWTFPKGHLEAGEDAATAAVREVYEETGIRGVLGAHIDRISYLVVNKKGQQVRKHVDFFVMTTTQHTVTLQHEEGISAYQWVPPAAAQSLIGYTQHQTILTAALRVYAATPPAPDATPE